MPALRTPYAVPPAPAVAVMFPGQGSQQVGMGAALLSASPAARQTFAEADECLGFSLSRLCLEGPEPDLTRTDNLQPALLTVGVAAWRALQERAPFVPVVGLGHSLGEYGALVAAGAISFADALRVVRRRGELMAQAVPAGDGGMTAVLGLSGPALEALLAGALQPGEVVTVANLNAAGQVVISGHRRALERIAPVLREAGARGFIPLKVSAPFHSPLMQPAADGLRLVLNSAEVVGPRWPVLSNVTAAPHAAEAAQLRARLVEQVIRPVRWVDCLAWPLARGVRRFLEFGPGKVLAGLLRRAEREARCLAVAEADDLDSAAALLAEESPS